MSDNPRMGYPDTFAWVRYPDKDVTIKNGPSLHCWEMPCGGLEYVEAGKSFIVVQFDGYPAYAKEMRSKADKGLS